MMIDLLNKTTSRRIKLLKYLFYSQARLSFKEISIEMRCTVKVVRGDLDFLSTDFFNQYFEIDINNLGILATFQDNVGPDILAEFILNESVSLDIIEYIFKVERTTLEELADEFHLSVSTVYRELKDLNITLSREFDLHITSKPIRIMGDEYDIRRFYLQYFSEKYSMFSWPFEDIDEYILEELLKSIFKFFGRPLELVAFRNVKMTVAISFRRFTQGFKIINHNTILNESFEELCSIFPRNIDLNKLFGRALTPELLNEVFHTYVTDKFFLNYNDFVKAARIDQNIAQSYLRLSYILDTLSNTYDIQLHNKEDLIYHLHSTAVLDTYEINADPLFHNNKDNIHQFMKENHPEFYEDSKRLLNEYLMNIHHKNVHKNLNHLVYTLFSHWTSLFIEFHKKMKMYKVVIISANDYYHGHMMKDFLDVHLCNSNVEFSIIDTPSLNLRTLEELECDFIIANITLPKLKDKKCIYVDSLPSYKYVEKIKKAINDKILYDLNN